MYRFPKDFKRCKQWVIACKNPKLVGVLPLDLYNNSRLCENHFAKWCFMNSTDKTRLVSDAVPDAPFRPVPRRPVIFHIGKEYLANERRKNLRDTYTKHLRERSTKILNKSLAKRTRMNRQRAGAMESFEPYTPHSLKERPHCTRNFENGDSGMGESEQTTSGRSAEIMKSEKQGIAENTPDFSDRDESERQIRELYFKETEGGGNGIAELKDFENCGDADEGEQRIGGSSPEITVLQKRIAERKLDSVKDNGTSGSEKQQISGSPKRIRIFYKGAAVQNEQSAGPLRTLVHEPQKNFVMNCLSILNTTPADSSTVAAATAADDVGGHSSRNKSAATEMDAIDMLFLRYAKTLKTFSPQQQAITKLKIARIFMEQELEQVDDT